MNKLATAAALSLALGACSDGAVTFPVTERAQARLAEDVDITRLDATNIQSFSTSSRRPQATQIPSGRNWAYTLGPGDVLTVIVFDHPELTLPAGAQRTAAESGFSVQSDGTFFYPFIGQVRAAGRPPEQIRADVTQRLAEFIPDPQVEVRVAAFNSQSIVVAGEVSAPNRQPLTTVPLTLIEAVNAAGGLTDEADARGITIQRGTQLYQVDLQAFLATGIVQNNPVMRSGDVVNIPRRRVEEAYLLGQVQRPAVIDLSQDQITLTQAITRQGGLQELGADARGIFVFRQFAGRINVIQLDISSPVGILLGTRFVLEPGDVIYIVRSPLQRWNDTISRLLPSVLAVSAVEGLPGVAD